MILKHFKRVCALAVGGALLASCGATVPPSDNPKASAVTPSQVEQLRKGIAPLVDHSAGSIAVVHRARGLVQAHVLSGHQEVMLARRNQDGSLHTACVDTEEGAVQALSAPVPGPKTEAR